jgi:TolB protein
VLDLASGEAVDIGPGSPNAWSPDGTRLLVQSSEGSVEVGFYIGVYDVAADGSGERKIGNALGQAMPVWSPDGALIAFFHGATVVVLAADGSGRFEIPAAAAPQFGTAIGWSPDGEWLVFSLERGLITTIYVVARDGTGLRALTEGQAPGWQPRYE